MVPVLPVASTVTCVLGGKELEDDAVTQENTFHFHTHNYYSGVTKVCISVARIIYEATIPLEGFNISSLDEFGNTWIGDLLLDITDCLVPRFLIE